MNNAKHLKPGERLYTGERATVEGAAAYNAATDKIQAFLDDGKPAPENLLNGRHNLFAAMAHPARFEFGPGALSVVAPDGTESHTVAVTGLVMTPESEGAA